MRSQQLLGLTLIPASLIGVICNWLVVIATWRTRSLSHSFSLLTAYQAVFNGFHSTLYLFYITPMIVLKSKYLLANSHHCLFILYICYDASIHAHFLITINRFFAVFRPLAYKRLFSSKSTKVLTVISFLISVATLTYFFQIQPCIMYYDAQTWGYTYNDHDICWDYGLYGDIGKIVVFSLFNVIVDLITIGNVRKTRKLMKRGQSSAAQKKEMDCLKQCFSQAFFAITTALISYIISISIENNVAMFASLIGVICNWLVLFATLKCHSLSYSFSLLTANQAVFNGIHSTLFLFYDTPMILLQSKFLIFYSVHGGFLVMLCYDASMHAHSLTTINRFFAVYMPLTYKRSFSFSKTKIMITLSFSLSLVQISTATYILPCGFYYNTDPWGFEHPESPICNVYVIFGGFGKFFLFSLFNVVMDVMTMYKARRARKVFMRKRESGSDDTIEFGFVKQSFSQSIFALIFMIALNFTPVESTDEVVFCLLLSLNGIFTLKFNPVIRNSLRKPKTTNASVITLEVKSNGTCPNRSLKASLIGVICNWLVVFATLKGRSLSHSFSLLTANQAVINGIHSTLMFFYATPMIMLQSEVLIAYSASCGLLLSICYDASIHSHFLISINRFCAVCMPITYKVSFSLQWTKTMIVVSLLLSIIITFITSYILPCKFIYVRGDTGFNYSEDPVCLYLSLGNLVKLILFSLFNMVSDTITISRVRKIQKVFIKSQGSGAKNQKTELGFIKQSFSQSLFSILFIFALGTIQFMEPNQLLMFIVGTVLSTLVFSLNGVLTLKYNLIVRNSLRKPNTCNESVVSVEPRSSKI